MKIKRRNKFLALFLAVCQLVTVLVLNVNALSSSGIEFTCGDSWVLEENGSAVNTGDAIEGITQGVLIKVPNVDFSAAFYRAIALKTAADNKDFSRVEVYVDSVNKENLLTTVDFKSVGTAGLGRYSQWAEFEYAVEGTHDLYLRAAAGKFDLLGFKLGSEEQLLAMGFSLRNPLSLENTEPEVDGVIDEQYETIVEMRSDNEYNYWGQPYNNTYTIKQYVTDEYLYLTFTYYNPAGYGTGAPYYSEIAIDPDPSNSGDFTDITGTRKDERFGDLLCYFEFDSETIGFADGYDKGNLVAKNTVVAEDGVGKYYTAEFRINRPNTDDTKFRIGTTVYEGGCLMASSTPVGGMDVKQFAGMIEFDYPSNELEVDGVIDDKYETILEMTSDSPYNAWGPQFAHTYTIKQYVTDEYLYLTFTYYNPAGYGTGTPYYSEIAIDPDPSNSGDFTDISGTRLDGRFGDLLCYFAFEDATIGFADNVDKGNLVAKNSVVAEDGVGKYYTAEFRINRPDTNDTKFRIGTAVFEGGCLLATKPGADVKQFAGMVEFKYDPSAPDTYTVTYVADGTTVDTQTVEHGGNASAPGVPAKEGYTGEWDHDGKNITADTIINAVYTKIPEITVDGVIDDKYETILEMTSDSQYNAWGPQFDHTYTIKQYVTDEYLYLTFTYYNPAGYGTGAPYYSEIAIDPDPSNSGDFTDISGTRLDGRFGDLLCYFAFEDATIGFADGVDKGNLVAKNSVVAEDGVGKYYTAEFRINRPDTNDTKFRIGTAVFEGGCLLATKPGADVKAFANMIEFPYPDAPAPKTYTVTYVADGTTVDTQTVEEGRNAVAPAVPEKEGYIGEWDHDGKNITADTTINAVYTKKAVSSEGITIDGVIDDKYETILEMTSDSKYNAWGPQFDHTYTIKQYATNDYLYLTFTYYNPAGYGTGKPYYSEIAIDPDPSNSGNFVDLSGTRKDERYGDLLCYFEFDGETIGFADGYDKGNLVAKNTITNADGSKLYTAEFRINRPKTTDTTFRIGTNVMEGGCLLATKPGEDMKVFEGMVEFPYPAKTVQVDGVVEDDYETILEMKSDDPYNAWGGKSDHTYTVKKFVNDDYLYLAFTFYSPDGNAAGNKPYYSEIAIDPDPSNSPAEGTLLLTRMDEKYGDLLCYFEFDGETIGFADGYDKGNLVAKNTVTNADGSKEYTAEFRIKRPDTKDTKFRFNTSVTQGGCLYATTIPTGGGDLKEFKTMLEFPYEDMTDIEIPEEPIVNGVLDDFYKEGTVVELKPGSKYEYTKNSLDMTAKTYTAVDDTNLYFYMQVNLLDSPELGSNFYTELNFDPDPSNSQKSGDNSSYLLNQTMKDFRIYWQMKSAIYEFGHSQRKGVMISVRCTELENGYIECAMEIAVPRTADGEYAYAYNIGTYYSSMVGIDVKAPARYENMTKFKYADSAVATTAPEYNETEFAVASDWEVVPAVKENGKVVNMHTGYVVKIEDVDFGENGARYLQANGVGIIDSSVAVYVDDPNDPDNKIGFTTLKTGKSAEYGAQLKLNKGVYGVHDIYLVSNGGLFELNAIKLSGSYPVYAVVDGVMDEGLYDEDHVLEFLAGSAYQIDENVTDLNHRIYYYVTDDYFYLYSVSDFSDKYTPGGDLPMSTQLFIDPDPSDNTATNVVTALTTGATNTEIWFIWDYAANTIAGINVPAQGSNYVTNISAKDGRRYYAVEMKIPRPEDETYCGIGYRTDVKGLSVFCSGKAAVDPSWYVYHAQMFYRDPIKVDGERDDTYTDNTLIQLAPNSDYQVGDNPDNISTNLYYEFDNDNVYFYVETQTKQAPTEETVMTLFADVDPFNNNADYATMTDALDDIEQSESGFKMALNGDSAVAERIGKEAKDTQVVSKVSGPNTNGVYTYVMEVSLPRVLGENYFNFGYTVTSGDICILNLAKDAAASADSYEHATKAYFTLVSPLSWLNIMGKQPKWDANNTNKNITAVSGSVDWSFPYKPDAEEKPDDTTSDTNSGTTDEPTTSTPSTDDTPTTSTPSTAPSDEELAAEELRQIVEDAIATSESENAENVVLKLSEENCLLTPELLELLKETGKPIRIEVYDDSMSNLKIYWDFTAINDATNAFDPRVLDSDNTGLGGKTGMIVELAQKGTLPGAATIGVPHNNVFGSGDVLLTYVYNEAEGVMQMSQTISATITADGFVTLNPTEGGVFALIKNDKTNDDQNQGTNDTPVVDNNNGGFPWWAILLICAGGAVVLAGAAIIIIVVVLAKKRGKKEE